MMGSGVRIPLAAPVAAYWRRGDLDRIARVGIGGTAGFGTVVTWFLLGGDVYTAYTFIAVPALVFGAGAIGFFALPYTIIVYPLVFLIHAAHVGGGASAQLHHGRRLRPRPLRQSAGSSLAVAVTGIVATMPYIALQLLGLQVVIGAMGVGAGGGSPATSR